MSSGSSNTVGESSNVADGSASMSDGSSDVSDGGSDVSDGGQVDGTWVKVADLSECPPGTLLDVEAGREIMRQLRLRDLGGIIVVDFIDMKIDRHKREVEQTLREESRKDRSQMVILPLSDFCLMQIARQKTRPSLQLVSHDPCPACGGAGTVKSIESMALEIMRELKSTLDREDIAVVEARVSPDVAGYLKNRTEEFQRLEEQYRKRIQVSATRELASNRVEFSCYNQAGEKVVDFVR